MRYFFVLLIIIVLSIIFNNKAIIRPKFTTYQSLSSPMEEHQWYISSAKNIFPGAKNVNVHSASIALSDSGHLISVWFEGSREGAGDVKISGAIFDLTNDQWGKKFTVLTRTQLAKDLGLGVRKLGNPTIIGDGQGNLWLFVVSTSVGGWAAGQINMLTSIDQGQNWGKAKRLYTSPIYNIGTMVRTNAAFYQDGTILLPAYFESGIKYSLLFHLNQNGDILEAKRINNNNFCSLQPTLAALNEHEMLAFMRDCSIKRKIHISKTIDHGNIWSTAQAIDIPNPNKSVAALTLKDGGIILVYNNSDKPNQELVVSISYDQGKSWKLIGILDKEDGKEFSYPSIIQNSEGKIHIVYSWKKQSIRHVTLSFKTMRE